MRWLREFMGLPVYLRSMLIVDLICSFGIGLVMPIELLFTTHSLGATMSQATLTVTISSVGALICHPIIGWLSDKKSPWLAIHLALIFSISGPLVFAFSRSLATAMIAAFISGLGMSMATAWVSILTLISSEKDHNIVYGINQAEINLGIGLGAAVGGLIAVGNSEMLYRIAFAARGIGFLLVGLALFYLEQRYKLRALTKDNVVKTQLVEIPENDVSHADSALITDSKRTRHTILTMFFLTVATLFMNIFGYSQFDSGLVATLISHPSIPRWSLSLIDVVNTFGVVTLNVILLPRLKDGNHILMLRTVPLCWAVAWFSIDRALTLDSNLTCLSVASLGMLIYSFGEVMLGISQPVVAARLAGTRFSGRMFGLLNTAQSLGRIFGPLFASFVLAGQKTIPLLSICALGLIIVALPWLFFIQLPGTRPKS